MSGILEQQLTAGMEIRRQFPAGTSVRSLLESCFCDSDGIEGTIRRLKKEIVEELKTKSKDAKDLEPVDHNWRLSV